MVALEIIVLNLPSRPDRRAFLERCLAGLPYPVEFIAATDATAEEVRQLRPLPADPDPAGTRRRWLQQLGRDPPADIDSYYGRSVSENEIACFLSHVTAWRKFLGRSERRRGEEKQADMDCPPQDSATTECVEEDAKRRKLDDGSRQSISDHEGPPRALLILEDDAVPALWCDELYANHTAISQQWRRVLAVVSESLSRLLENSEDEFDLLYLGRNRMDDGRAVPPSMADGDGAEGSSHGSQRQVQARQTEKRSLQELLVADADLEWAGFCSCLHAYILTPSGCAKLLHWTESLLQSSAGLQDGGTVESESSTAGTDPIPPICVPAVDDWVPALVTEHPRRDVRELVRRFCLMSEEVEDGVENVPIRTLKALAFREDLVLQLGQVRPDLEVARSSIDTVGCEEAGLRRDHRPGIRGEDCVAGTISFSSVVVHLFPYFSSLREFLCLRVLSRATKSKLTDETEWRRWFSSHGPRVLCEGGLFPSMQETCLALRFREEVVRKWRWRGAKGGGALKVDHFPTSTPFTPAGPKMEVVCLDFRSLPQDFDFARVKTPTLFTHVLNPDRLASAVRDLFGTSGQKDFSLRYEHQAEGRTMMRASLDTFRQYCELRRADAAVGVAPPLLLWQSLSPDEKAADVVGPACHKLRNLLGEAMARIARRCEGKQGGNNLIELRWLLGAPAGAGFSWHVDPHHTAAWNLVLEGGPKRWEFAPPGGAVPMKGEVEQSQQKASRLVARQDWNDAVYIPAGWWHATRCESFCLSFTENIVSEEMGAAAVARAASDLRRHPGQTAVAAELCRLYRMARTEATEDSSDSSEE